MCANVFWSLVFLQERHTPMIFITNSATVLEKHRKKTLSFDLEQTEENFTLGIPLHAHKSNGI